MKVIDHIEKAGNNALFSFEIVPPPRGRNVQDLTDIVKGLEPYNPSWIDVTAHPAGAYYNENPDGTIERKIFKKRPGTIGICGIIQNRFKIDTVAHLLTQGFTREETEDALIELNYLGIHNVLALRGDGLNYNKKVSANRSVNTYAIDLVNQIQDIKEGRFLDEISNARPLDFCMGVAGYPEKHFEAPNMKFDLQWLKKKVEAGADYVVTQMFFDTSKYINFVKQCREEGINVPIVPGLKVLKNMKQLTTIPRNFYIDFPDELVDEVTANPKHIEEIGVRWAIRQSEELLNFGVPSLHFYVMNDTESVKEVVKKFY
ncbi:methylenetetrahydrofolate reductase [Halobacteriovorax sp. GB3]|uniref:methylenetetrahydrofolate reductase n=1 Tax=Halobacteriovorax sp. GB3 TaxID=2719615 RepID=UPI0023618EF3|nr:methylenetetrahydrofolate reductase [Halobacteriovorax sp. GB3]MDD0852477.1 methylenetetrahydrofolate reductase [Halobacteriovorax sp. GB3]